MRVFDLILLHVTSIFYKMWHVRHKKVKIIDKLVNFWSCVGPAFPINSIPRMECRRLQSGDESRQFPKFDQKTVKKMTVFNQSSAKFAKSLYFCVFSDIMSHVFTEGFQSGQMEQTVNLSPMASMVRIHPPPPYSFSVSSCFFLTAFQVMHYWICYL